MFIQPWFLFFYNLCMGEADIGSAGGCHTVVNLDANADPTYVLLAIALSTDASLATNVSAYSLFTA